jgi:hypothetical protein
MSIDSLWYSLNINDFSDYKQSHSFNHQNTYITFQTSDFVRVLKAASFGKLPVIIDLESFDKQMSQEGKEFSTFKNWKVLLFLRHNKIIDSEFKLAESNFKLFLEYIALLYIKLLEKDNIEKERFEKIEIKINQIIFERQFKGVRINLDIAKQKCFKIEEDIYNIKNILQLQYNIFSPDSEELQIFYLKSKGYNFIKSLLYTFKINRNEDPICKLFYELIRNERDLDSFIFILSHWGGQERTYPSYHGFGTITSRITLRQPSLQNLKKVNRDIIVPDIGMKLLYIDYSQFEAGILASLSKDEALIKLYSTGIYDDLAEKVLGNSEKRSEAKIIFYRYMYGDDTLSKNVKLYFKKFQQLEKYRQNIDLEISKNKKVRSVFGNYRFCLDEEHVWSLSHVIQSTASLIYKNALIRVRKEMDKIEFLIPMHDATLYQLNEILFEENKSKIETIYKEEFKKICPEIEPMINFDEFIVKST